MTNNPTKKTHSLGIFGGHPDYLAFASIVASAVLKPLPVSDEPDTFPTFTSWIFFPTTILLYPAMNSSCIFCEYGYEARFVTVMSVITSFLSITATPTFSVRCGTSYDPSAVYDPSLYDDFTGTGVGGVTGDGLFVGVGALIGGVAGESGRGVSCETLVGDGVVGAVGGGRAVRRVVQ